VGVVVSAGGDRMGDRDPLVVDLGGVPVQRSGGCRSAPGSEEPSAELAHPVEVTVTALVDPAAVHEAILAKLPQRLELPVASAEPCRRRRHQRTRNQTLHQIDCVVFIQSRDRDDPVEQGATGEHAMVSNRSRSSSSSMEYDQSTAARAVPLTAGTPTAQQLEPVGQPTGALIRAHRPTPRRGELDRQRDPVHPVLHLQTTATEELHVETVPRADGAELLDGLISSGLVWPADVSEHGRAHVVIPTGSAPRQS
jgi:hypothetical protein